MFTLRSQGRCLCECAPFSCAASSLWICYGCIFRKFQGLAALAILPWWENRAIRLFLARHAFEQGFSNQRKSP